VKIAAVALNNPLSLRNYSGSPYYMLTALRNAGHQVRAIYFNRAGPPLPLRLKRRIYMHCCGKKYAWRVDPGMLRRFARYVDEQIACDPPDIILTTQPAEAAYIQSSRPLVLWFDALFSNLHDFYNTYKNLHYTSVRHGKNRMHFFLRSAVWLCSPRSGLPIQLLLTTGPLLRESKWSLMGRIRICFFLRRR
jgi:hypothetical protein